MPRLIKNGELAADHWAMFEGEEFARDHVRDGHWVLPMAIFNQAMAQGNIDFSRFGVSLDSDDDAGALANIIGDLQLIVLNFKTLTDGRSFSQARILRDRLDYSGELRAVGAFLRDQMFYLSRCGVNAFILPAGTTPEAALTSLRDFSDSYQAACDEPQPLFRRRL